MNKYRNIIFLDEENTALGVLAQALLIKKFNKNNVFGVKVASRGNVVLFPEPANPKITEIAKEHGMDISSHVATQMEDEDFQEDTLVLALDTDTRHKAYSKYDYASNVYTLREFIGEQGDIRFQPGKDIEEYEDIYSLLDRTLETLCAKIKNE